MCAGFQLHEGARTGASQAPSFLTLQEGVGREDRDGGLPGTKAEASLPPQPFPSLRSQYACRGFLNADENIHTTLLISFLQIDLKHLPSKRITCEITKVSLCNELPEHPTAP